ncbi:MAG: alpha/beta hydrolase [Acidobacteriota bacterium]
MHAFRPLALLALAGAAGLAAAACAAYRAAPATPSASTLPDRVAGPHGTIRFDAGDGDPRSLPVLFVHGNGGNRGQWAAQMASRKGVRRAAALDLSGMGDSESAPGAEVSVEGYAADVEAVADALGYGRYVVVGHSYGGAVVAACAGRRPDRIAGVVFADSAGDLHRTPEAGLEPLRRGLRTDFRRFTDKWFEGILAGSRPETHELVLQSLHRSSPDVFIAATEALYRFDLDAALSRYPGPRLSLSSMLFANPVAIHRTVPGVPVRRIENASHWLMMDRPEEFDRELDAFLAGL